MNVDTQWAERRKLGIGRFLFLDGVIYTGGPFAVLMQVLGYFLFPGDANTFGEYFGSSMTWLRFFLHATLFGLVMGFIKWRRNENAYHRSGGTGVK